MRDRATLSAQKRTESGSPSARRMRREGYIPAIVYGRGDDAVPLKLDKDEFEHLIGRIRAASTVIGLEVEGEASQHVLIREMQRHPFRADVLHVDFFQLQEGAKIQVTVPIHLEGLAPGVEEGGILQQTRHELTVECLPDEIPEGFTVDVTEMEIGDSIHVGDIDVGTIVVLNDADLTLCTLVPPTVITVDEEEEDEEGLEPAIVGEEDAEEGEDDGEDGSAERGDE